MHGDATGCKAFKFLNNLVYRLHYSELWLKSYSIYEFWTIMKLLEKIKIADNPDPLSGIYKFRNYFIIIKMLTCGALMTSRICQ